MGRLLNRDLGLQLLAVLLALVLWVQASAVGNPVARFAFDALTVTPADAPADLVVTGALHPAKVNITVMCRRRIADKLSAKNFKATVSLEGARVGTADYLVEVVLPPAVELVEVSPASVTVTIERLASAKVQVDPRVVGIPEGFVAGTPAVEPAMATVHGPASVVEQVMKVVAELDVGAAGSSGSGKARLIALDGGGLPLSGVTFTPADIVVTVSLSPLPAAESIDVDPILTGSPASGYAVLRITCNPGRVEVRPGPGGTVDFDHVATVPVDISGSTSDVRVLADLVVPAGVVSVVPLQVEVVVEIGASRGFLSLPVAVRNAPSGLMATVSPLTVDVVVRGPRALLDRLVPEDLAVWVDATGRSAGQSTLTVNVDFPAWSEGRLSVSEVTPSQVTLLLGR